MSFVQLLRSIEDLIYEIMTWLVYYPRTLWRVIRHPVAMIDYSEQEQGQSVEEQYTDSLSPPLFLFLSIILAHGLELVLHAKIDAPAAGVSRLFPNAEESLIFIRLILFCIFPLVYAVGMVKRSNHPLERKTLRAPFFSQCYLGAVFAILMSDAAIMIRFRTDTLVISGIALAAVTIIWYITIQSLWFAEHLKLTRARGVGIATALFLKATLIDAVIAWFLSR
jgi:hypothetical protein